MRMTSPRLLLIEDDGWLREELKRLFSTASPPWQLLAACATGEGALEHVAAGKHYDVALVDLGLPGLRGVQLIRALRRLHPAGLIVVFTIFDDPPTVVDALRSGACGYLLKSTPPAKLPDALREAMSGGAPMTPSIARVLVNQLAGVLPPPSDEASSLTPRERDVLGLLAKGLTYADVARGLGISLGTVQSHVRSIYGKLEIASKAEAAAVATRLGLL